MQRLGGQVGLICYALQPASITFMVYNHDLNNKEPDDGELVPLKSTLSHSPPVYKVQEAFNNITFPEENV